MHDPFVAKHLHNPFEAKQWHDPFEVKQLHDPFVAKHLHDPFLSTSTVQNTNFVFGKLALKFFCCLEVNPIN